MDAVPAPPPAAEPTPPLSPPVSTIGALDSSVPGRASPPAGTPSPPSSKPVGEKTKIKKRKKLKGVSPYVAAAASSSASSSARPPPPRPAERGARVLCRRRGPRVLLGAAQSAGDNVEAMALPLGMSFAAVVAQVLEREYTTREKMSVDHLSQICTSAVRESLSNGFGNKFTRFASNFEMSFGSTLRTLRLISESSSQEEVYQLDQQDVTISTSNVSPWGSMDKGSCSSSLKECREEPVLRHSDGPDHLNMSEEAQQHILRDNINCQISQQREENQLACISRSRSGPVISQPIRSTFEKSVVEQTRSNDLKEFELGLAVKKMKLKEAQLSLTYDANHLGRSKLAMGISKASFKAEKFKNELEDARHLELLKKCIDCLVAGLIIMSLSLLYGAYVFSYQRVAEATESCSPSNQQSRSWWIPEPVVSFSSGIQMLRCQVQVLSRMLFGVLMILIIAYLLLQRSATSNQTMPVTFLLLLLGVACGFAGKLCVDTLGGSGFHWLIFWETLCFLHFLSNIWTRGLFVILHGPVSMSQGMRSNAVMVPYWIRRVSFYAAVLIFLPLLCGLIPFASPVEWKDHFSQLIVDRLSHNSDSDWS
ncbi:protein CPR-5 [Syzygium oleosum]|uniref:protein CPR-5 n=1 Tax=Syzygium oleosum TaxID=219896 RepID=UPI0011D25221|nr:protein CPR-5 [Syzygium oleosum]